MYGEAGAALVQILEIVWINLLLSGDNAVVIALACRSLAPQQRRLGILLGTCAAVALRLLFTLIVVSLLTVPILELIGGAALLWIAVKLLDEKNDAAIMSPKRRRSGAPSARSPSPMPSCRSTM